MGWCTMDPWTAPVSRHFSAIRPVYPLSPLSLGFCTATVYILHSIFYDFLTLQWTLSWSTVCGCPTSSSTTSRLSKLLMFSPSWPGSGWTRTRGSTTGTRGLQDLIFFWEPWINLLQTALGVSRYKGTLSKYDLCLRGWQYFWQFLDKAFSFSLNYQRK